MSSNAAASRPPSVASALTESAAALVAQLSITLLGFMDAYFMAKLGVETLATMSYVTGFVILVNASFGGALQAFLIVGGGRLGSGDKPGFSHTARAAMRAGMLLCGVAYLTILAAISLLSSISSSAPRGALVLVVLLAPGILLNAACLVFRLKAMLLKAPAVLVAMSLSLVVAKFIALTLIFHLHPFSDHYPLAALAGSSFASALVCLAASWALDRWRFVQINLHRSDARAVAAFVKRIIVIGLPIGAVIVLEMSVLGIGQMIQTLLGVRFGAAFGLVIQFVLLAQTVAVALGQVTTIHVSIACNMRDRGALAQAVKIGVMSTALLHGVIAVATMAAPGAIIELILPQRLTADAALVDTLAGYLRYGAVCQLMLAMVVCLASILRGMDDLGHPIATIAINYLGLGVVLSAAVAYLTPLRDLGVWIGIAASLASSVTFLGLRVVGNVRRPELLQ
ncbi:hypothetical protein WKR88_24890 [Trinickia caryophylli]|uniref:Na+-driven multidrug efflux pump n=1 Tax=Trinickia caryophylli TaxID=28094 RepID=A0A1X7G5A0_TRICW|nr:hypothetical protein [Trinickia caryophylli]TRX14305.1 hypothetical protein FNF07_23725 [Trinickia caryophylli]WQE14134.1 hypothetical protein U0034_25915 [Trinickia caryophylli]GLU33367.1 hypothetical protein Busp01_32090 [Trinickia caryophylli]SMF64203.1 Na+-driven multidrug efflux pump [Trinickia caryophylli]